MSDMQELIYRQGVLAYNAGMGAERNRIVKLLEDFANRKCQTWCDEKCECYAKAEAEWFIRMIKGNQSE
jgi:hypothetical protein